ncbi:MAG: hypothetical protein WCG25_04975 [bacterium]
MVRLDSIWTILLSSSSLHITGSSFHSSASFVRSFQNFHKASMVISGS